MKTKEELKELKARVDELKNEIASLSNEELAAVVGGVADGDAEKAELYAKGALATGIIATSTNATINSVVHNSISLYSNVVLDTATSTNISTNFNAIIIAPIKE